MSTVTQGNLEGQRALVTGATATVEVLARTNAEGGAVRREDVGFVRELAARRVHQGVSLEVFLHAYRVALLTYWDACAEEATRLRISREAGFALARSAIDAVDTITTQAAEAYLREAGFSGDPQPRGFLGARVPVGEQRDSVRVQEDLEADPLVDAARRQFAHEPDVLAAYRPALGLRSGEHLHRRRRACSKVVDQVGRGVPVVGDLVGDPRGDRLADLGIPTGERLAHATHRTSVTTRFHILG